MTRNSRGASTVSERTGRHLPRRHRAPRRSATTRAEPNVVDVSVARVRVCGLLHRPPFRPFY